MSKRIDFLIGGIQKSGTTALYEMLKTHPDIFLPKIKELHYFDTIKFKNDSKYQKYHSNFNLNSECKIQGEATPNYIFWTPCLKRIHAYNSYIKWILIFRNPIERAYSQWNMNRLNGWEKRSFIDSIKQDLKNIKKFPSLKHRRYSYISRGFYFKQVTDLFNYYDSNNILFIKHEDFKKCPNIYLNKISIFLGVKPINTYKINTFNSLKYERKQTVFEKKILNDIYLKEIERFEKFMRWDCSDWKA